MYERIIECAFVNGDFLPDCDMCGRNGKTFTGDPHVSVRDELARMRAGGGKAEAVHDVVEARFNEREERFFRVAFAARGFARIALEFLFGKPVNKFEFLFLFKTRAKFGSARLMLALVVRPPLFTLRREAKADELFHFWFLFAITCHGKWWLVLCINAFGIDVELFLAYCVRMSMTPKEEIIAALKTVVDPEIHADIYTLGLIYNIETGPEGIDILMTLTTPFCPYGDEIVQNVEKSLAKFGQEVRVELTFEPEWKPSEETRIALGLS